MLREGVGPPGVRAPSQRCGGRRVVHDAVGGAVDSARGDDRGSQGQARGGARLRLIQPEYSSRRSCCQRERGLVDKQGDLCRFGPCGGSARDLARVAWARGLKWADVALDRRIDASASSSPPAPRGDQRLGLSFFLSGCDGFRITRARPRRGLLLRLLIGIPLHEVPRDLTSPLVPPSAQHRA